MLEAMPEAVRDQALTRTLDISAARGRCTVVRPTMSADDHGGVSC
jgi:hypothetical protein